MTKSTHHPTRQSLITIEQVADALGVSVRHIRRLVAERRIPYLKWGHLLRFDPLAIDRWLDERSVPVGTSARLRSALHGAPTRRCRCVAPDRHECELRNLALAFGIRGPYCEYASGRPGETMRARHRRDLSFDSIPRQSELDSRADEGEAAQRRAAGSGAVATGQNATGRVSSVDESRPPSSHA